MPKFNALITSYDTAINDAHFLRKIKWECLIVDEAHRLKNNESKFFKISSTISTKHKVLLTGKFCGQQHSFRKIPSKKL